MPNIFTILDCEFTLYDDGDPPAIRDQVTIPSGGNDQVGCKSGDYILTYVDGGQLKTKEGAGAKITLFCSADGQVYMNNGDNDVASVTCVTDTNTKGKNN